MKTIDAIIIHCSATRAGQDVRAADIDKWHKERGFAMIGYNYVIDLDGKIETGRPLTMDGAHCNTAGLSGMVCLAGMMSSIWGRPRILPMRLTRKTAAADTEKKIKMKM